MREGKLFFLERHSVRWGTWSLHLQDKIQEDVVLCDEL